MKKILSILALFGLFVLHGYSQTLMMTSASYTVTDGGTASLTAQLQQPYQSVSIQLNATRVSGTVGGTAILQVSLDGSSYKTHPTADTLTLANTATNVMLWPITGNPYLYYKVLVTGTGTMVATIDGIIMRRR